MPARVFSCDSKKYLRQWSTGRFFGALGVCLQVDDKDGFASLYESTLASLTSEYALATRATPKGYDIARMLQSGTRLTAFLEDFAKSILSAEYLSLFVCHTTLNPALLPDGIRVYWTDKSRFMDVASFINLLTNYYAYVCGWKVAEVQDVRGGQFVCDHFEGPHTPAWTEFSKDQKVEIVAHGDCCDRLLSATDFIVKWVDNCLREQRLHLDGPDITQMAKSSLGFDMGSRLGTQYIGHPDLRMIAPESQRPIDLASWYRRPIIRIVKPGLVAKERVLIEASPLMHKVYDAALELGACPLFFDIDRHKDRIMSGDKIVPLGEHGEATVDLLREVGYDIETLDL